MRIVGSLILISIMMFCSCRKVEEQTATSTTDTDQVGLKTAEMIDSGHFVQGEAAPDFSWGDITTNTLKARRGNVILIVAVDPEQSLTKHVMETITTLWDRHNQAQLTVLILYLGNNQALVDELKKKNNIKFDQAWISQSVITALDGLPALPTFAVVDRGGKVARVILGERDLETWETLISPCISESIPPNTQTR
jgi:hypothetical protein